MELIGADAELTSYLESIEVRAHPISSFEAAEGSLVVVSSQAKMRDFGREPHLQGFLAGRGKALFLNPNEGASKSCFPLAMWNIRDHFGTSTFFSGTWDAPSHWGGERAFVAPGHFLAESLVCSDDLRWWNSGQIGPSVCEWAFERPRPRDEGLISLFQYVAPHGYLESARDFSKYQSSLVLESRAGKGKLIASTLCLADDPLAKRVIANLISYAST